MNELTERRQRLLDQIRTHGPEHFDMGDVLIDKANWVNETYDKIDFTRCGTTGCLLGHAGALMARHYRVAAMKPWLSEGDDVAEFFGLDTEWFWNWDQHWPEHARSVYEASLPGVEPWGGYSDREPVRRAEWLAVITLLEDLIKEEA